MDDTTEKKNLVPALHRMDQILQLLSNRPDGLSLNAISSSIQIPKSTAYRILSTLNETGYVRSAGNRHTYALGPTIMRLAKGALEGIDIASVAKPYLTDLSQRLGETVKLSVVKGSVVEVIACVESSSKLRISVTVGEDFPIHAGAASKVLLAFLPETFRNAILTSNLQRFTPHTIVDPEELRTVLEEIRRTHVAYDREEFVEGIRAIGAPIFNVLGDAVGAISVAYLAVQDRDDSLRAKRARSVLEVCRGISLQLGATPDVFREAEES